MHIWFQADLKNVQGVFLFFGVFLGLSTVVFFCEMLWSHVIKKTLIRSDAADETNATNDEYATLVHLGKGTQYPR